MFGRLSWKVRGCAGGAALLGTLALSGASAAADSPASAAPAAKPAPASAGGVAHLTSYSANDGPTATVILTGVIGDYGQAVYVYPDGTVDPDHDSELSLELSRGTLRLDVASLDKEFVAAIVQQFPTDASTCSGSVEVTRKVPVVAGSGTGAYLGVSGTFVLTATLDEVDPVSASQPCDGTAAFLSQAIIVSGPGTILLRAAHAH